MKKFKVMIMALLVACSVFIVAGSAMAIPTQWEVSDLSNYDILSFNSGASFVGNEAFVMNVPDTGTYVTVLSSSIGGKFLYYNPTDYSFYNSKLNGVYENQFINLSSSNGRFSFYFYDGTNYLDAIPTELNPNSSYLFNAQGMSQIVGVQDVAPATVPIPATALLFTSGFAGLIGFRRRKK